MESNTADFVKVDRRRPLLLAVVLCLTLAEASEAWTVEPANAREISREQATQEVQKRYGGAARVVRTDITEQAGHHVYVFRLLSANGRVWVVRIDAQSGAEVP
jgi:uncharacterized membrane protein YkoI